MKKLAYSILAFFICLNFSVQLTGQGQISIKKEIIHPILVKQDSISMVFKFTLENTGTEPIDSLEMFDELPIPTARIDSINLTYDGTSDGIGSLAINSGYDGDNAKQLIDRNVGRRRVLAVGDSVEVCLGITVSITDLNSTVKPIRNGVQGTAYVDATNEMLVAFDTLELNIPIIRVEKTLIDSIVGQDSITYTWLIEMANSGTDTLSSLRLRDTLPFGGASIIEINPIMQASVGTLQPNANYDGQSDYELFTELSGDDSKLAPGDTVKVALTVKVSIDSFVEALSDLPLVNISEGEGEFNGEDVIGIGVDTIKQNLLLLAKELTSSEVEGDSVKMKYTFTLVNGGTENVDSLRIRDEFPPIGIVVDSVKITKDSTSAGSGMLVANDGYTGVNARNLILQGQFRQLAPGDSIEVCLWTKLSKEDLNEANKPIINEASGHGRVVSTQEHISDTSRIELAIPILCVTKTMTDSIVGQDSITYTWLIEMANSGTDTLSNLRLRDTLPFGGVEIIEKDTIMQASVGVLIPNANYDGQGDYELFTELSGDDSKLAPGDTVKVALTVKVSIDSFVEALSDLPLVNISEGEGEFNGEDVLGIGVDTIKQNLLLLTKELTSSEVEGDSVKMKYTFTLVNGGTENVDSLRIRDEFPPIGIVVDSVKITKDSTSAGSGMLVANDGYTGVNARNLILQGQFRQLAPGDSIEVCLWTKLSKEDLNEANKPIINEASGHGRVVSTQEHISDTSRIELAIPILCVTKTMTDSIVGQDSITYTWLIEMANSGTDTLSSLRLRDTLPFGGASIIEIDTIMQASEGTLQPNANYDGQGDYELFTELSGDDSKLAPGDTVKVALTVKVSIDSFVEALSDLPLVNISEGEGEFNGEDVLGIGVDTIKQNLLLLTKELTSSEVEGDSVKMKYTFTLVNGGTENVDSLRIRDEFPPIGIVVDSVKITKDSTSAGSGMLVANDGYTGVNARNLILQGQFRQLAPGDSIEVCLWTKLSKEDLNEANKPIINEASGHGRVVSTQEHISDTSRIELAIPILCVTKTMTDSIVGQDSITYTWLIEMANSGTDTLSSLRLRDTLPFGGASIIEIDTIMQASEGTLQPNGSYDGQSDFNLLTEMSGDESKLAPGDTVKVELTVRVPIDSFVVADRPLVNIAEGEGEGVSKDVFDKGVDTIIHPIFIAKKEFVNAFMEDDSLNICFNLLAINNGTELIENIQLKDSLSFKAVIDTVIIDKPDSCPANYNDNFDADSDINLLDIGICDLDRGDTITVSLKFKLAKDDFASITDPAFNIFEICGEWGNGNFISDFDSILVPPADYYKPQVAATKAYLGKEELEDDTLKLSFEFEIMNTGNTYLDSLSLKDSLVFNSAIVGGLPMITIDSMASSTDSLPTLNAAYDGESELNIFDKESGLLGPGESVVVRMMVKIDPYKFTDIMPQPLLNQACFSAIPKGIFGGSLVDPETMMNYSPGDLFDLTDDGTDRPDNGDPLSNNPDAEGNGLGANDMDDPTPINICETNCEDIGMPKLTHLSLGSDCEAIITASMLSDSVKAYCDYYFDVEVYDKWGQLVVDDVVDDSHLGTKVKVVIREPECGNETWGEVLVEDKMPPVFGDCKNDTISCEEFLLEPEVPEVDDNCGVIDTVLFTQVPIPIDHCDEDFIAIYERTWIAYDAYGNSDTCVQLIYLERIDLDEIEGPDHFSGEDALECKSGYMTDGKGNPSPSVTGSPTYNDMPLYGGGFEAEVACNINVDYEDKVFPGECLTTIMRTWTVYEWCYNQMEEEQYFQMIEIRDTTGPEIVNSPKDVSMSTGLGGCGAYFNIPKIEATDNCQEIINILVQVDGISTLANGATVYLEMGDHEIIYEVADKCGNVTYDTLEVEIIDNRAPQAICIQESTVQLDAFGFAKIHASTLDNRSFDQCSGIEYKVRRMDATCNPLDTIWGEQVEFCCADAGKTIMVAFMVIDEYDNENQCMVNVNIPFKFNNPMMCPPDVNVDCGGIYVLNDLNDDFGEPQIKVCPEVFDLDETQEDFRDNCGLGEIVRHFYLRDLAGNLIQYCSQTITVGGQTGIDFGMIDWPENFDTTIVCNGADLDPEFLPDSLGKVILPAASCTLTSIKHVDTIVSGGLNSDACYKIFRTWKVLDWCDKREGSFKLHTYEQVIKVSNVIPPTILSSCNDTIISSLDVDCDNVYLELPLIAEDDCTATEDLNYIYRIDTFNTGLINIVGSGSIIKGSFPIGIHKVFWEVNDGCGNVASCDYLFEVRNEKEPEPKCKSISLPLTPMYLDMDADPDTLLAMITPAHIDLGSNHPCGYDIQLSFSMDVMDDTLVFGCDDVGENSIELWVTDEFGNQNFCFAKVIVTNEEDSLGICGDGDMGGIANIEGTIGDRFEAAVEGVEVSLIGSEMPSFTTNTDGDYAFENITYGGNYMIKPKKEDGVLNGVSTLDLLLIQRHILGLNEFDSALDYIAADITNNGKLTASDILVLRKVILGIYDSYPDNTSWRFVDKAFNFTDNSLWNEDWPSDYRIDDLNADMAIDFTGIKIGDVSGDAIANSRQSIGTRSAERWAIEIPDVQLFKNQPFEIPFYGNSEEVKGIQFALQMEDSYDLTLESGILDIKADDYYSNNSMLRLSHSNLESTMHSEPGVLFVLKGISTKEVSSRELLSAGMDPDFSEVYLGSDFDKHEIELNWISEISDQLILNQNAPNPWRTSTIVKFFMPKSGKASFVIRDMVGKSLYTKSNFYNQGDNSIIIRNDELPVSGVLIYEIKFDDQVLTKKMIHLN